MSKYMSFRTKPEVNVDLVRIMFDKGSKTASAAMKELRKSNQHMKLLVPKHVMNLVPKTWSVQKLRTYESGYSFIVYLVINNPDLA